MRTACSKLQVVLSEVYGQVIMTVSLVEICLVPIKIRLKWLTVCDISPAVNGMK